MAEQPQTDKNTGASDASHIAAYSKRILTLRRLLPLAACLLLLLLVLAANPDFVRAPVVDGFLTGDDNDRLVIDRPVFEGRLPDGRRYQLAAVQGGQKTNGNVGLSAARLTIEAAQGRPAILFTADKGFYRVTEDGTASLSGNVVVETGDGRYISAPRLDMNIDTASWQAPDGATMRAPSGDMTTQQLSVDETSGLYRFRDIKMRLRPRHKAGQAGRSVSAPTQTVPSETGSGLRFATDAAAPIDIEAGLMAWQRGADKNRLSDGARIQQGPLTLSAARIDIVLADDGTAQSLIAEGEVVLISEEEAGQAPRRAKAEQAVMDLSAETLVMRGNVAVVQMAAKAGAQESRLSGGQLALDLASGKARLTGGGDKPRARIELR
jgi:lipopolysaccharide transport protein LptA